MVSEAQQKEMMAKAYRRQEELKKLEENSEDDYFEARMSFSKLNKILKMDMSDPRRITNEILSLGRFY